MAEKAAGTCAWHVARNAYGSSIVSAVLVFAGSRNLLAALSAGVAAGVLVGGATFAFDGACEPVRDSAIKALAGEVASGRY